MSILRFLTKRYITTSEKSRNFSFFSIIAIVGIAIGVATLIIALSVLDGFEKRVAERLIGFDSHIQVLGFGNRALPHTTKEIERIESILQPRVKRIVPFVSHIAIVGTKKIKEGLTIKGVNNNYFDDRPTLTTIAGELTFPESKDTNYIILGKTLATKLMANVGDKVALFALKNNKLPTPDNMPTVETFYISGIFESGMAKYDDTYAYADMKTSQQIFGMRDSISGYEIQLSSLENLHQLAERLQRTLPYPHLVKTFYQSNRHIFIWIELQRKPIPIVLGLIIIVAVFNIISALLMLVLEKTNAIGTLKALGATNGLINKIFLMQGTIVGIVGIIAGNVLAFVLAQLQLQFDIIKLPGEVYFVNQVPLHLTVETFLMVSVITLPLSVLTAYIPGYIASKINPVSTLRFR